jgi:exopolyphosphatase/guanosine-5'-triphosphate,3'-diphosphate pyrophosphatase
MDLGSSSFHLLVADASVDGIITPVMRERVMLNLGLRSARTGRLSKAAARKAADTVVRFRELAARAGAERVLPVATSALRDSANRAELSGMLERSAGTPVRFVDGAEEARLTFAGIRASVALGDGSTLALDL